MSKRGADVQGGRDGWFINPLGSPASGMDTPRRATAAQMAHRKIVRGRLARRPGNFGGQPTYDPVENQKKVSNPFTAIDPNILSDNAPSNASYHSQQSDTSTALQNGVQGGSALGASQSFPPNNSSVTPSSSSSASFSGFQSAKAATPNSLAPPTSMFNFASSTSINNPFTPGNAPIMHQKLSSSTVTSLGGSHQAFRGSIFNLPAGMDSVPLFAPMPSEPLNNMSSEATSGTQPEATSITPARSSIIAQSPTTTNVIGQTAVQQDNASPTTTNIFGKSMGSTSQPKSPSTVSVQSAEKMQISPDTTPAKVDVPKAGAFSFLSQPGKDNPTEVTTKSDEANLFSKLSQPLVTLNPPFTNTDATTVSKHKFSGSSRRIAPLKGASAAPKTISTKGLFSGLLMPPSTQSPLASKQQPRTPATGPFLGSLDSPKPMTSNQPPPQTPETPIQKEKLANGVSTTPLLAQATGRSQTSNIFRDIVGNSKAPAMEVQNEKLANGVNGATPVPQTNKMPQASNVFGNTPEPPEVPYFSKADKFMGMPPSAPVHFTEDQKKHYVTLYRTRSLDLSFQKHVMSMTELQPGDVEHAVRFYTETHAKILAAGALPLEGLQGNKRKFDDDETPAENGSPSKKSKPENGGASSLQTNGGPPTSNIFNSLQGDSKEASAAQPPKISVPTFKPPTFIAGKPANFLAQFGQTAAETERKEKAKRKAEDFDSDEDDEAEWERKYAEEQRVKKQKLAEAAKGKVAKFVPGKGFVIEEDEQSTGTPMSTTMSNGTAEGKEQSTKTPFSTTKPPVSNGNGLFGSTSFKPSTPGGASVFDSPNQTISTPNIFGHLSDKEPADGTAPGKSLFDRISRPSTPPVSSSNIFGSTTTGKSLVDQISKPPTPSVSSSNIFGSTTPGTSLVDQISRPPTPSVSSSNIFGSTTPGNSLVDQNSRPPTPSVSSSNIFGSTTNKPVVGFGFGGPPKTTASSLLAPSAATSAASSRATSPGLTTDTGGESANESTAEGAEVENTKNAQQLNLTNGGPGEEEEDVLFEVRAKALMWTAEAKDEQTNKGWQNKGIGPFRVLKHRKTGKARIIMRLDPSGRLVLNAALLDGVTYEHQAPSAVKMAVASEGGKLNTWVIKVKKDEDAIKLASILEGNKSN